MQSVFSRWHKSVEQEYSGRLNYLESHTLKAQRAIQNKQVEDAIKSLLEVNHNAGSWFEQVDPSPRLTALYVASSCLLATSFWKTYQYAKAFSVLERASISLKRNMNKNDVSFCRKRYYQHCLRSLQHSLDEVIINMPRIC